ncbi:MAG: NADH:ubiquinone reductase (Na(+)-transporting) subunit F [Candidatus Marinimicrobia bacterium]|mgnify:FL=1|jgi:Na+-transporting NADH:ubiquinone oxidoreductase subunit F|nr:NADH:ubiquinone reductase (Na(+)-transporting) subunit F [Candidatus Neomarinimicrobiota bacterium]MBT4149998.1 NADH:ubiquinone reductase (Na(+)-transporting) subunit F [Candidatus Neomarinimicrobiota bacterium]MBT4318376.1 NADH:ubiquinone reductase (Na(+)-transporting) subunit F [Candidatus Neomarinimicrobiota bacterium]MBT4785087.1 NADH:ubiquinone reductase (Na(+)-transporting) subunit F [Candidatus Neomarinimicrobiota bacterium]MBT5440002.1 NADH:ubiquinone reductase (Na(+)-transporting) s|tara:strand:+ start:1656 stop:2891 length:1236 start_codon:yes stop_codon:yes gene_type:complete
MITASTLLSVAIFSGVILILVLMLNFAESKLLPQGNVSININGDDDKSLQVRPGSTLLSALATENIFLPSACGGGGTCAMCKCQVNEGGGEILSTEKGHISRTEAKENWRLACQVKIKEDMKVHVPDEIFNIQKWDCTVRSNNNVATFIKELVLELPKGENLNFTAGGYIQIDIPEYHQLGFKNFNVEKEYHEDWDKFKIWDVVANNEEDCFRAYSMANHPAEGNIIMLNVRIATPPPALWDQVPPGIASSYIFNLKKGDKVTISGPFGEFFAKDSDREMIYLGGGAGMAPMRSHLFDLLDTKKTDRKITFFYGARSAREMFYHDDFLKLEKEHSNFKYIVGLSEPMPEDKWEGPTGFIHNVALEEYLKDHEDPTELEYYMCGPPMMIDACDKMLYDLGVEREMIAYDSFG